VAAEFLQRGPVGAACAASAHAWADAGRFDAGAAAMAFAAVGCGRQGRGDAGAGGEPGEFPQGGEDVEDGDRELLGLPVGDDLALLEAEDGGDDDALRAGRGEEFSGSPELDRGVVAAGFDAPDAEAGQVGDDDVDAGVSACMPARRRLPRRAAAGLTGTGRASASSAR
jgi:hypothetical protein